MSFKQYYFTELYSQWVYKPQDVYYDFYAMTLISPEQLKDQDLAYSFEQAKKINIEYIKNLLIEQLEKAISSELGHYLKFRKKEALTDNYIPKELVTYGGNRVGKFYSDYVKEFCSLSDMTFSGKLIPKTETLVLQKAYNDVYKITKEFMKKHGYTSEDLFIFGKAVFNDASGWISDNYGGKSWVNIANEGLKILDPNNQKDQGKYVALLDHTFDLEHNSGSIFSKSQELDQFEIKGILDDKREIKNEMGYYFRVSNNLKGPLAAAIKDLTGKTVESEKSLIDLEDMLQLIYKDPGKIKLIKNPPVVVQRKAVEIEPSTIMHITHPDVEVMKLALDKDPTVFKYIKDEDKNRLPKQYITGLYGNFKQKRKEPAFELA